MKKQLSILLMVFALAWTVSSAHAKKAVPPAPTAAQQQAFMEQYFAAVDAGQAAFKEFSDSINNKPGDEGTQQANMLSNMKNGKAPDGGELKGFRGDPNDPGPMDWSNWDIETDANGNVTGFKEKDFEAKDKDGDGKISDTEREEWNKKKKEEHDAAGGAPGEVDNPPDWDKDRNNKPDPGFSLDCYKCVPGQGPEDEDHCRVGDDCQAQQFCEAHGYFSDASCASTCKEGPCVPIDVDKQDGRIVPSMQTRAKGSTEVCFTCMKITEIEVEYIVIIIETPHGRVILGNPLSTLTNPGMIGFSPQKVMALATPNNPAIANFEKIAQMTGGQLSMYSASDIAGVLSNMLDKKTGNNPDDCFKDLQSPPVWKGEPPSSGAAPKKAKKKDKSEEPPASTSFGEDAATALVVDGPVIACGTKDGETALAVFDSHGGNAQLIDKKTLAADPKAILNGIQKAQGFYQRISAIIQNPIQALTQEGMSLVSQKITERREPEDTKAKPKKKKKNVIEPNDPLYFDKETADKKAWKPHVTFGGGNSMMEQMAGGAAEEKNPDAYDQWYLRTIGYTPKSDKNSAWNVFTPAEPNVTVAVIDSGVDMQHVDGPKYIWKNTKEVAGNGIDDDQNGFVDDINGWNFLDDTPDFPDYKGHGTAVAGIIAAQNNNEVGIAGINPGAVIMPLKAADENGTTNSLAIYRAINYAVDQGANIINISLGGRGLSQLEQSAVSYARSKGVFIVVASGNTGEYLPNIGPAAMRGVVAVGMVNMDGTRSPVSSSGANNGLLAPGERIISLKSKESFKPKVDSVKHKEYFQQDGTSFAAPMVSATASLILARNPQYTANDLETILMGTAKDMDDAGWDETTGAGLLDASAALRAAPENIITVVVSGIEIKRKETKGPVEYVDVYGTVRGPFKDYSVGLGKGKRAGGFKKVSAVYTERADNKWLARITSDQLNGSEDWVVQIAATPNSKDAKPQTARAYFSIAK